MNFKKSCTDSIRGGPRFCAQLGPFSIHGCFVWAHFLGPLTNSPCPFSVPLITYHTVSMNFSTEIRVQNSGRPRELEKSKRKANGKQLVSYHAMSRSVTNSLIAHGGFNECSVNANALRTQPNARVKYAWATRDARVTHQALQKAPTLHRTSTRPAPTQHQTRQVPNGLRNPLPNPLANGSKNNVIFTQFNVRPTLSSPQAMLQASRKPNGFQKKPSGLFWVSVGFPICGGVHADSH